MLPEEAWKMWRQWFKTRGWNPLPFQEATWAAHQRGQSGLLHVPTGAGKTYAAYAGALVDALAHPSEQTRTIYITPLRALARDIEKALRAPVDEMKLPLRVDARTGDTSSHRRNQQKKIKPHILVTTPESLALLISYANASADFSHLQNVIIDEWHELLSSKRGSLLELTLCRLRQFSPQLKTWALSATLSNPEEAALAAVGINGKPVIIRSEQKRPVIIESLLPPKVDKFPWAGHLGLNMLGQVLESISLKNTTLIFTNTRSQAERWFQGIQAVRPQWAELLALHHGSLDRLERERVETGLKEGQVKLAVCTSSLDLGIDLPTVEQVIQIGSPKGIGRLIQRAGRAAHAPGLPCHILFVPTHALELVEIAAVRAALAAGEIEARPPFAKPLDVLAQHLVTAALGGGFEAKTIFEEEIKQAYGFRNLTDEEMGWTLALVREGGTSLKAYPGYHKVVELEGRYQVTNATIARQHRQNIGTIVSDSSMLVRFVRGKILGTVEESYIGRLRRGEKFLFSGKLLELVMVRDLTAYVRKAKGKSGQTPRWYGGRLPFSPSLSFAMRRILEEVTEGKNSSREVQAIEPILKTQKDLSLIPNLKQLLIETCQTRDGEHLFLFPFEGRLVHEGLASLLAYRLGQKQRTTFSLAVNDYGIELLAPKNYPFADWLNRDLLSPQNLVADVLAAVNLSELARRQFREIARVAGLVIQNHRGSQKTDRQLQASAALLFDVFSNYDPENLLLIQARREVLEQHFEQSRLTQALTRLSDSEICFKITAHPTPLAFPLVVERLGAKLLSTESLLERIERMTKPWDRATQSTSKPKRLNSSPNMPFIGQASAR